jgi:hypothetical protein
MFRESVEEESQTENILDRSNDVYGEANNTDNTAGKEEEHELEMMMMKDKVLALITILYFIGQICLF